MTNFFSKTIRSLSLSLLILAIFMSGFPSSAVIEWVGNNFKDRKVIDLMYLASKDKNVIDRGFIELLKPKVETAHAANFQMQTGYYVGNGGVQSISGLGFKPEMILLKGNTNAGSGAYFKTSAMPMLTTASLIATADVTPAILLDSDGFTVTGGASNTTNERHTWVAFTGSDCTASGTFCVGSYVGSGTGTRMISTGFQPDLVIVKRSINTAATWRSSTMTGNQASYFTASTTDTTGFNFTALNSTGFTVGSANNANTAIYYYVAFKESAGIMDVGTYTGNNSDNRNITGVGFQPDFMFTKSTTNAAGVYNITDSYGDSSSYFADTANLVNSIQSLQADGFQVGTDATANGNGNTYHYAAFGGANDTRTSSGTFSMASGSYTGTGMINAVTGLNFAPDLVIIKREGTTAGVFRTRMMGGDSTAYLDSATANIANAIISLNPDGFTIGTSTETNLSANVYHWQAFGNAWRPEKNSGASDFFIGAYYGNGIDNRDIKRLPFQTDMLVIKKGNTTASAGVWRSSIHAGDASSFFAATADTSNNIQTFNTDGFEIGTAANVNTAAGLYWYFGFKEGSNFDVGGYTGDGLDNRDIADPGFQPDLVWIKRSTTVAGVTRPSTLAGDMTQYFINTAQAAGRIKSFVTGGFRLGTQTEVNANTGVYKYAAWATTTTPGSAPSYNMQTGYYVGNGGVQSISGLGFKPEMILIKSNAATGAFFKTHMMPNVNSASLIAAADVTSGIHLDSDGFNVTGANTNANLARHTWIAFTGSDCTASGKFCVGSYSGSGTGTRMIPVGFQPDMVIVKKSDTTAAFWRNSSMPTNHSANFSAGSNDTSGAFIASFNPTGFTVGAGLNNIGAPVYYFVAFKEHAGVMDVGTYTGNGSDNRSITGVGFQPDFVFTKSSSAVAATYNVNESYGDSSSYFQATANLVDSIQALQSDGFQVGTNTTANANSIDYYYAAFGGADDTRNSSGTFSMANGSYTGTGQYNTITGLDFAPDLVIIKREGTTAGVFRTRSIGGDSTAYLDAATGNITNAITSLNPDGFTVNTATEVNTAGNIYHWQAFGNAWRPEKNSGASDFFIGAYYGNGIDNRDITRLPFQPDLIVTKRNSTTGGAYRTSAHSGDLTSLFSASIDVLNNIQAINSDGFQIGTAANVNNSAGTYFYFGFKEGPNFDIGTYTGNGLDNRDITDPGFQPDLVWVKRQLGVAVAAVTRPSTLAGDLTQYFINTAQAAGRIKSLISGGFRLGTVSEVNADLAPYLYVAWNSKKYSQGSYRLFNNDNSTDVGTALAITNTPGTLASTGDNFRLRMLIGVTGGILFSSSQNFKLQFAEKSGTCDAAFSGETYADITGATVIAYDTANTPADGDDLTANVNDPTASGSVNNQDYEEANNFTNSVSTIASGEYGKWDFSLIDNGADAETSYCIRAVKSDGSLLNSYIQIPEIITAAGGVAPQSITFSISDNTVGFGTLSPSSVRYATGDTNGSGSDSADAHTISASTNADGGYVITVNGNTLTCSSCGGTTIDAIGGSATASSIGTEQFGLRVVINSGTGSAVSPYSTIDWAFDASNFPDQIASGLNDDVTTEFGIRYIGNINSATEAGSYSSVLTYTITGTF